MYKVKKEVDKVDNISTIHVSGRLTFTEIMETVEEIYKPGCTEKILLDLLDADLSSATPSQMETIVSITKSKAHLRPNGKTAFVAPKDTNFGFARMYESMSELNDHPIDYGVFRNTDQALEWLGVHHH